MVVVIISIVTISSVLIVLFTINKTEIRNLHVDIFPNSIKSCPEHTTWLLVNISFVGEDSKNILTFNIETNTSIDLDWQLWNNSVSSRFLEIFLYPSIIHIDLDIEVKVTANVGKLIASDVAIVSVVNWTFGEPSYPETLIEPFISYLSVNKTTYQIDESTSWEGIWSGIEILIVQHYLFKSDQWEMEVSWHVMVTPHDWVKIYLRKRFELNPIWAGMIESWSSGNYTILDIEPPEEVYR